MADNKWKPVLIRFTPRQYEKLKKKKRDLAHIIRELVDKHIK